MTGRRIVVIGTGGLGRETLWGLRERSDVECLGFLTCESEQHGTEVCGAPVLGSEDWIVGREDVEAVCAIGEPRARRRLAESLAARGVRFGTAVHPSALMSEHVTLGAGCIVGARAVLTTQVRLGEHVVVGVHAVVSHDCALEDFATLAPGVVLAGHVHVETAAELGAGATVVPRRRVGRGALVGAHAAVVSDVEPNQVVAGVPARPIRTFPDDERL